MFELKDALYLLAILIVYATAGHMDHTAAMRDDSRRSAAVSSCPADKAFASARLTAPVQSLSDPHGDSASGPKGNALCTPHVL